MNFSNSRALNASAIFLVLLLTQLLQGSALAFTLPENFTDTAVIQNLQDPDGFAFSPDGRIFISERITGKLRIAKYNSGSDTWSLEATPFYTFNTPKDGSGNPEARRSGGLRDIAFDPNFLSNGYVYAFYMSNDTLHNRVVRIKASAANADLADATETLLIDLPFNNTNSSGSHNGGALEFGADGKLYITTGDGWEGAFAGDPVQSLSTFTGKVLRINADGSIPSNNPFYVSTTGTYRAIYALGLRNPYSMAKHPGTNLLYINEARGNNKASIYIVAAQANYKHEGTGIGTATDQWADASGAGGELITGGAWMPTAAGVGNFPDLYDGRYFTALWGSNSSSTGRINTIRSNSDTTSETFETGIGVVGGNGISVKPVVTRINQATSELFYMLTTYTTSSAQIRRVRFTSQQTVATPIFSPDGGNSPVAISITVSSATAGAEIRYTLDNTSPTQGSTLYASPFTITNSAVLRAVAFKPDFNNSSEASAVYIIGDTSGNIPPDVNAGPDKAGYLGQSISLDGSATTDPDGNDDFLTGEQWTQLAGPIVTILDATEEIAYFTPTEVGVYRFQLEVSDGIDTGADEVVISVIEAPRILTGLQVLYTFEEGAGSAVNDVSGVGSPLNLTIDNPASVSWLGSNGINISSAVAIESTGATKIISACKASNDISVESWLKTSSVNQSGPARIVSLSGDIFNRNVTLGQEDDRYDVRLRTTATNDNGTPSLTVPASTIKTELTHAVYTRDAAGNASIYINGVPQVVGTVSGNLSNWDDNYSLILANEFGDDRSWLGELYLVAVYCHALSSNQVSQNFSAGLPPYAESVDTDSDNVPDIIDNCPNDANSEQINTDGDAQGDVCDADKDNDGIANASDSAELDNKICQDLDADLCDDCAVGVDGFGPLSDANPANDGPDNDHDGSCDAFDNDDDNDTIADDVDNCPFDRNADQADGNGNGIGDACDSSEEVCVSVRTGNGTIAAFCL